MKSSQEDKKNSTQRRPPARTPEARENQMISLAIDLAEKQLQKGTASSQVITHYLKTWINQRKNRERDSRKAERSYHSKD